MRVAVINPFGEEPLERVQESWTEYGEGNTIQRRFSHQLDSSGRAFEVVAISDGWERHLDPDTGAMLAESFIEQIPLQSGRRGQQRPRETEGERFSTHEVPVDPLQTYRDAVAAGIAEVVALSDDEMVIEIQEPMPQELPGSLLPVPGGFEMAGMISRVVIEAEGKRWTTEGYFVDDSSERAVIQRSEVQAYELLESMPPGLFETP